MSVGFKRYSSGWALGCLVILPGRGPTGLDPIQKRVLCCPIDRHCNALLRRGELGARHESQASTIHTFTPSRFLRPRTSCLAPRTSRLVPCASRLVPRDVTRRYNGGQLGSTKTRIWIGSSPVGPRPGKITKQPSAQPEEYLLKPTDVALPDYFHKVVDCQWACPAHTPVPEYIRMIAAGRHSDAYMVNWESNVFPGILGRTCDRPCEPACRRGRVEESNGEKPEPVAICRLKRVAADNKDDIRPRLPKAPEKKNGRRIACIGAGPASLTVARDLVPLGYHVVVYDSDARAGGMIRTQIPRFRLPESVIDEEVGYVLDMGVEVRFGRRVDSMKSLLVEGYDAIFVGTGAPRGRDLDIPGRKEAAKNIHVGIDWLASVSFGHTDRIGKRVIVLGGGNTAMDCCRTSRRLGGEDVKVIVRSGFEEMKASPW